MAFSEGNRNFCHKHKKKFVNFCLDHGTPLCAACFKDHSGHKIEMLENYAQAEVSKLQSLVALSSAEAEYMVMIKGVHEALASRTILLELDIETHITLYTDSAAAKGSVEKPGLMHMKHMQLRELFLKQVVQQGIVTVEKIATENNPADILTKAADKTIVERFWQNLPHRWERVFEVNWSKCDLSNTWRRKRRTRLCNGPSLRGTSSLVLA